MSWLVTAIAALGVIAWWNAARNYRATQELLAEARKVQDALDARDLAATLAREAHESEWRHLTTRGGLN